MICLKTAQLGLRRRAAYRRWLERNLVQSQKREGRVCSIIVVPVLLVAIELEGGSIGETLLQASQSSLLSGAGRDLTLISASIVSDVEMAQEEVFAGPMSESIPSSVTGFAHRRPRADSVASFTYFQEEDESPEWSDDQSERLNGDGAPKLGPGDAEPDLESGSPSPTRRESSAFSSRDSVDRPLLNRYDSTKTDNSASGRGLRTRQKIYVETEDLTIVVAGFSTHWIGFALYTSLCVLSAGVLYLIFRWIPSWRIRLVGSEAPLKECEWVVVEVRWLNRRRRAYGKAKRTQNQWGEMEVQSISKISYGYAVSTVFGQKAKASSYDFDEDDDPIISDLRMLDYRYVRFCFHPMKDKFVLCGNWKDPAWKDPKSLRHGLDSEERTRRAQVFDKNQIDIKEKSIPQLLVDEVGK